MNPENEYIRYIEDIEVRKSGQDSLYCKIEWQNKGKVFRCIDRPAALLSRFLDLCPVGDGLLYEHFVLDAIGKILVGVVDGEEVLMHVPSGGGYHDIEFAFCTEALPQYNFWEAWYHRYAITSIIVETKNETKKVRYDATVQIKEYIEEAKKGQLGMLVSRNGFTINALKKLCLLAKEKNILILPITHQDLQRLLELSMRSALDVFRFLRVVETRLRRIKLG